jgi:putative endonuclease
MNNHILGRVGENHAETYLTNKGYEIIARNWRSGHKEVDLIASKDNVIIFFEIKTRANLDFGNPEESVTRKKMKLVKEAAHDYLVNKPIQRIQFDIIAMVITEGEVIDFLHMEDAY